MHTKLRLEGQYEQEIGKVGKPVIPRATRAQIHAAATAYKESRRRRPTEQEVAAARRVLALRLPETVHRAARETLARLECAA